MSKTATSSAVIRLLELCDANDLNDVLIHFHSAQTKAQSEELQEDQDVHELREAKVPLIEASLIEACRQLDAAAVASLGQRGADPNACDAKGEAALIVTIRQLYNAPEDLDAALDAACRVVEALAALPGFDPSVTTRGGSHAVMLACGGLKCDGRLIRVLASLPGIPKESRRPDGASCFKWLSYLCQSEDPSAVSFFIDQTAALDDFGYLSNEDYYHWDLHGQCALFWAGEYDNVELAKALFSLPGYSVLEQIRRIRHPETGATGGHCTVHRWPLVNAVIENSPRFIAACGDHMRDRGEDTREVLAEVFDAEMACMPGGGAGTLVALAVQNSHYDCIAQLHLAGARTDMYDMLPLLVGPHADEAIGARYAERVRARFVADFDSPGDVDIVSVEPNKRCLEGLIGVFRSALDVFRSKHGAGRAPTSRFLWHCTTVPETVCERGLDTNFSSMDFNVYGVGLYFAADAKLSAFYARPDGDGVRTMLLALVLVGRTGVREPLIGVETEGESVEDLKGTMVRMGVDLTQPQHRNPPVGCDSATGPHCKELAVFSSTAAIPAFVVRYRLRNQEMPNPYVQDTASRVAAASSGGKEYLRPLQGVPLLLGGGGADGAPVEGELDIDEEAQLLPMGTFPTTREEARRLRRQVAADRDFSAIKRVDANSTKEDLLEKCKEQATQIGWLKAQLGKLQQMEADNTALRSQLHDKQHQPPSRAPSLLVEKRSISNLT